VRAGMHAHKESRLALCPCTRSLGDNEAGLVTEIHTQSEFWRGWLLNFHPLASLHAPFRRPCSESLTLPPKKAADAALGNRGGRERGR
jgi:hypothetical protein